MADDIPPLDGDRFEKLLAAKRAKGKSVQDRRSAEANAILPDDGRIKNTVNARGEIQLNVRMTPDLKNQIVAEARARRRDMGSVVVEALLLYFQSKRA